MERNEFGSTSGECWSCPCIFIFFSLERNLYEMFCNKNKAQVLVMCSKWSQVPFGGKLYLFGSSPVMPVFFVWSDLFCLIFNFIFSFPSQSRENWFSSVSVCVSCGAVDFACLFVPGKTRSDGCCFSETRQAFFIFIFQVFIRRRNQRHSSKTFFPLCFQPPYVFPFNRPASGAVCR